MKRAGASDGEIAARVEFFNHRCVEEFYDYEKDPDALNNLIDNPEYADIINQLRADMETWMKDTGDEALEVFRQRDDPAFRREYIEEEEARAETLNHSGLGRKRKLKK